MVTFWITLFVSVEIGIACGVGYSLVYILLHLAFTKVMLVDNDNLGQLYPSSSHSPADGLPDDTMLFMLQDSILYPNAARISRQICDYIYTYTSGVHEQSASLDCRPESRQRLWNDTRTHHVSRLRREASASNQPTLRILNKVILDLTRTTHIDTTGLQALDDMRHQILDWAGPHVSIRIVGANKRVRDRLERHQACKLKGVDKNAETAGGGEAPLEAGYQVFELLQDALAGRRGASEEGLVVGEEDIKGV